jgi:hypothetical protein
MSIATIIGRGCCKIGRSLEIEEKKDMENSEILSYAILMEIKGKQQKGAFHDKYRRYSKNHETARTI